jgi:hypothetical protein
MDYLLSPSPVEGKWLRNQKSLSFRFWTKIGKSVDSPAEAVLALSKPYKFGLVKTYLLKHEALSHTIRNPNGLNYSQTGH